MEPNRLVQEPNSNQPIQLSVVQQVLNQKGFFFPILAAVFIILLVFIGGYFVYQKQLKIPATSQQIPQATSLPAATQDETATWKTFANKIFGFEIQYPPDYDFVINDPYGKKYPMFYPKDYKGANPYPGLSIDFDPIPESDKERFKQEAKKFDWGNGEKQEIYIYFESLSGKKIYAACLVYHFYDKYMKVLDICNQMLSTFKFSDQSQSTDTSSWKAYTNPEGYYSIKYPAKFELHINEASGFERNKYTPAPNYLELNSPDTGVIPTIFITHELISPNTSLNDLITKKSECTEVKSANGKLIKVDGIDAKIYEDTNCGLSGYTDVYFINANYGYHIRASIQKDFVYQFLSTFKFTQ